MKRLGKLLLLAALSVSVVNASELAQVFGLKDKAYAKVTAKKLNKYKISDNFMLGISMAKIDTYDGYQGTFINGVLKNSTVNNWVFTENIYRGQDHSGKLIFTDQNGINLTINLAEYDKTCAGDQCFSTNNGYIYIIKVLFVNNTFTCYVNDKKLYSSKKRFGNLKSFSQNFNNDDVLIDMNLSEIK